MEPQDNEHLKGFNELNSDDELTPESLQHELQKYRDAFEQEFKTSLEDSPENAVEYTNQFFRQNLPEAAAQIVWLAHNADSESVRANMLKYIVSQAVQDATAAGDPVKELLASLSKNSKEAKGANQA